MFKVGDTVRFIPSNKHNSNFEKRLSTKDIGTILKLDSAFIRVEFKTKGIGKNIHIWLRPKTLVKE